MEGDLWNEQKRFFLRYMRDFGFGRRFDSLEQEIEHQISQLIDIVTNGPKYPHENVRRNELNQANDIICSNIVICRSGLAKVEFCYPMHSVHGQPIAFSTFYSMNHCRVKIWPTFIRKFKLQIEVFSMKTAFFFDSIYFE